MQNVKDLITEAMVTADPLAMFEEEIQPRISHAPGVVQTMVMLGTMIKANEAKEGWLKQQNDTTFNMETRAYQEVVERLGFKLQNTFEIDGSLDSGKENVFIYAHVEGLLLTMDSWKGHRNSAYVYAVLPGTKNNHRERVEFTGLGGNYDLRSNQPEWRSGDAVDAMRAGKIPYPSDLVLESSIDAREALAHTCRKLLSFKPLLQWPESDVSSRRKMHGRCLLVGQDYPSRTEISDPYSSMAYTDLLVRERYDLCSDTVKRLVNWN